MNPCPNEPFGILSPTVNSCPTGPTGPPGLQGSKGLPGRVDNDIIFDRLSVLVAPLGSDSDFELGNINKPCQTIQTAIDALPDGGTVHIIPGTYNGFTLNAKSNFSIRGWGEVTVNGSTNIIAGANTLIERINFAAGINASAQTCTIRSCNITRLNVNPITELQVRGCIFTGDGTVCIASNDVNRLIVQSCIFIAPDVEAIMNPIQTGLTFRDNLVVWNNTTYLAQDISDAQGRAVVSHNGIHVQTSSSITPASGGGLYNLKMAHNSFHNLTGPPIPFLTEGKIFSNALGVTYINLGSVTGNLNYGKLMTSHVRSVHTVASGTYTMTGDVTIVYVSGPNVTIELPPPVDGLIIEISVDPAGGAVVTSPDTIDIAPWGLPSPARVISPGRFVRLQWIAARSTWTGSLGTVTVP